MKILYVSTLSDTTNAFLIPHIKLLLDEGHKVDVAFNITEPVRPEILSLGCRVHNIPFQRSPLSTDNAKAYKDLKRIIKEEQYDIVHTHTPVSSFITRMVCRKNSDIKVVYTAFGFHFFKGVAFRNWLLYYPLELVASKYTDLLITVNKEDYHRAKKRFHAKHIEYLPAPGMNLKKFQNVLVDRTEKLKSLGVTEDDFVVLSVGELNYNKNHSTVIKAIDKLKDPTIKYLICGEGNLEEELRELIKKLGLEEQVTLLGTRRDLPEVYKVCDIFVFPSRREGLGMVSLEAMSSGLPLVTSNVHGIVDYSVDGVTGFTCDPTDADCFAKSIKKLKDSEELRFKMGEHNKVSVDDFELDKVLREVKEVYKYVIEEGNADDRQ